MPDRNGSGQDTPEKNHFIREKVVKPSRTRRQIAGRAFALFLVAIIFGIVAAVSFVVAKPFAQKYLGKETLSESTPVTIPRDEPEIVPTAAPTTAQASTEETEAIEDIFQNAMEEYRFSVDDLNTLYGNLRTVTAELEDGLVAVHSVKQETDWFNNPIENTGTYAGAVIAATGSELIIMTPKAAVEEADSIEVIFSDGTTAGGQKKQSDTLTGLAAVSVDIGEWTKEQREQIKVLELGNSYSVKQGDLVMAIGSPAGIVGSTDYGFISYIQKNVPTVDGSTRRLHANIMGNAQQGTFLANTAGQIIGWVIENSDGAATVAEAVSDYKSVLEMMINGRPVPYVGIIGQEVNVSMTGDGMPFGIYVMSVEADSPAYNAGIQNGDVVTAIGGKEISTVKEFQTAIEGLETGTEVIFTVQRNGRDEYKELEYLINVGAR